VALPLPCSAQPWPREKAHQRPLSVPEACLMDEEMDPRGHLTRFADDTSCCAAADVLVLALCPLDALCVRAAGVPRVCRRGLWTSWQAQCGGRADGGRL